jgi:hypothetical protein
MKYAFFGLILVNVVFFLWESNILGRGGVSSQSYKELRLPRAVEQITLLSERSASPERPADMVLASTSASQDKPEEIRETAPVSELAPMQKTGETLETPPPWTTGAQSSCFQWGPITEESRAREVLNLIKAESDQAAVVRKPSDLTDGWWVLFPKAHDMEAARANRNMLLKKGVTDLWLFDKGAQQGAISLGLFKTLSRAEQAQKRFTEQGIITEVVARQVRGDAFWVRIPWTRPASELGEVLKSTDSKGAAGSSPSLVPCD